ncbi:MAG: response regulator [Bacteriovorax sp.]|nr:response regulator [Bacteriovorax sp.]
MNILIVDDEDECAEIMDYLIKGLFPIGVIVHIANGGNDAIQILKTFKIDLCICDHNMPNGMGNIVLKYITDEKQKTKFVLCSTVAPTDLPNLYSPQNIFYNIQKPDVYSGIENLYKLIIKDNTSADENNDFIPITTNFLFLLGATPADIYIRFSNNKFVKCFNKNDAFDLSDFNKYQSKSLTKLFILKDDDHKSINQIIFSTIFNLMNSSELPVDTKMSIAHAQLSEMAKSHGMTPELAQITKENIQQSVSIITKTNLLDNFWKETNLSGEYPSDLYTLHSLLASVVAKKMVWDTDANILKLTIAAFIQDASLNSASLIKVYNYRHFLEIEKSLDKNEIITFMNHPKATKKMISFFKEIPNDIDRILLEQHEMPDGTGFPQKINAHRLNPLTCVFILTGILARCILAEGATFQLENFLKKFESEGYSKGNFRESFSVLKSMQI